MQLPVTTIAQRFADGERAAHALLQPAAPARPFLAHALVADDHLGHLTVAGAGVASVDGDEGVADQQLAPGALDPARPHGHEIGVATPGSPRLLSASIGPETWNVRQTGARLARWPVSLMVRERFDVRMRRYSTSIGADDDLPDAGVISQPQVCQRRRRGPLRQRIEHGGARIGEPLDGSLRRDQGRIDKRDGGPSARSLRTACDAPDGLAGGQTARLA